MFRLNVYVRFIYLHFNEHYEHFVTCNIFERTTLGGKQLDSNVSLRDLIVWFDWIFIYFLYSLQTDRLGCPAQKFRLDYPRHRSFLHIISHREVNGLSFIFRTTLVAPLHDDLKGARLRASCNGTKETGRTKWNRVSSIRLTRRGNPDSVEPLNC